MPDKCVKKMCPPHVDGRTRACNPETGRCKLVANVKANGTHPMTKKEIIAYLESSGAYDELAKFPAEKAGTRGYLLSNWMNKYATHVSQKLLKKLLDTPGKKVKLVIFDFNTEFDDDLYKTALDGDFEVLVATRLKDTDNAEAAISQAANYGRGWDDEDHPALKGPASDLVKITYSSGQFFWLVWLKAKETGIGRYDMVFTWLK